MFANGGGRSAQGERKIRRHGRQWSSPWTIIEKDWLSLPGGDLLNRGAWAATLTINICHIVTNWEDVFRMSPEDGRFDFSADVIDRS